MRLMVGDIQLIFNMRSDIENLRFRMEQLARKKQILLDVCSQRPGMEAHSLSPPIIIPLAPKHESGLLEEKQDDSSTS